MESTKRRQATGFKRNEERDRDGDKEDNANQGQASPQPSNRSSLAAGVRVVEASSAEPDERSAKTQAISGGGTKQSEDAGKGSNRCAEGGARRKAQEVLRDAKPESCTSNMDLEDNNRVKESKHTMSDTKEANTINQDTKHRFHEVRVFTELFKYSKRVLIAF